VIRRLTEREAGLLLVLVVGALAVVGLVGMAAKLWRSL
jgi:hypothetical protein